MQGCRQRCVTALLTTLLWLSPAIAGQDLMEDVDYRVIPQRRLTDTERIEVVYFFYYGCEWCFRFEPYVNDWLKKKPVDVSFRRIPALRNSRWVTLTRAFYAFDALGLLPKLHDKTFRAFHQDEVNLQSEGTLFDWVAKQGVDRDRFESVYRSEAVTTQLAASRELTDLFEIQSTPSVIVDGRYLTSSGMTGGVAELLLVMQDLIDMVRTERRGPK
jgi:thiol:disulfide interchange protein DsbA